MDFLYWACMAVAVKTIIIGWSVYTRYVLAERPFWLAMFVVSMLVTYF